MSTVVLRKRGRGYLRLVFTNTGRPVSAITPRRYLTPTTTRIIEYLES